MQRLFISEALSKQNNNKSSQMEPIILDHNLRKLEKKKTGQSTNCKILSLERKKNREGGKECLPHSLLGEMRSRECTASGKYSLALFKAPRLHREASLSPGQPALQPIAVEHRGHVARPGKMAVRLEVRLPGAGV